MGCIYKKENLKQLIREWDNRRDRQTDTKNLNVLMMVLSIIDYGIHNNIFGSVTSIIR